MTLWPEEDKGQVGSKKNGHQVDSDGQKRIKAKVAKPLEITVSVLMIVGKFDFTFGWLISPVTKTEDFGIVDSHTDTLVLHPVGVH